MQTAFKACTKHPYLLGAVTTFHKSAKTALGRARKVNGMAFQRNPFSTKIHHSDEMGTWEQLKP